MTGGGASKSSNAPRVRKRVEPDTAAASSSTTLKRAKDGSAFARCEQCNKDVAIALISMHSCSLDAEIKMKLEAQVVEKVTEAKKNQSQKKKIMPNDPKPRKGKKEKKAKNQDKPKRPPTAFFLFMDDFRKTYKETNPDCKGVAKVAKEGGERWKSMTDEEKKTYMDKAAELKAEYDKTLESSNHADNENDEEEDSVEKEATVETVSDDG